MGINKFPIVYSLFPIGGAGPGPAPPRVRGPRGRPSGGPGGTPTVRPCREGPADWGLDWGGDTSGYQDTIQSPAGLYRVPNDYTKPRQTIQSTQKYLCMKPRQIHADPIKPQNIIQRGKNTILLICFMIHKLEIFKNSTNAYNHNI